jgi:hypothetical protein
MDCCHYILPLFVLKIVLARLNCVNKILYTNKKCEMVLFWICMFVINKLYINSHFYKKNDTAPTIIPFHNGRLCERHSSNKGFNWGTHHGTHNLSLV